MASKKTLLILLACAALVILLIALMLHPIPQPQSYHNFADQRSWLGLPNAWNVLSNIPITLVGLWGLFLLFSPGRLDFVDKREQWFWTGVSLGLVLAGIGSSYYHLNPTNSRLVWDRLAMMIIFMSYVAALISERAGVRLGLFLWPILLGIGFTSVFQWRTSELQGASDLRFYAGVQLFAVLVTLIMLFTPSPYSRRWDLAVVVALFGLARLFEMEDHPVFQLTKGIISGHTLKHLASATAGFWLIRMLVKRKREN